MGGAHAVAVHVGAGLVGAERAVGEADMVVEEDVTVLEARGRKLVLRASREHLALRVEMSSRCQPCDQVGRTAEAWVLFVDG